ncbi:di-trans,poly-cis-decaprenylcistransferase [Candidatus Woesearchaeota archaeon]|nr:MAG: di-trans,poly-cis-decaprenylcistransferase [Candidatus Woesearchaeota archaeon]
MQENEDMYENVPVHIAIIPDGNRRWAEKHGLEKILGHKHGGDYSHVKDLCIEASEMGVEYLSFWGFSTENWQRPAEEIESLMEIVKYDLDRLLNDPEEYRFVHIGRKDRLPEDVVKRIEALESRDYDDAKLTIVLALDYGGRDEIVRAANRALEDGVQHLTEETLERYLDTAYHGIPDPDLIIRTGGEKRTSGFMPWQGTYAELYFTEVFFPDFTAEHLKKAVMDYGRRKRRFGK